MKTKEAGISIVVMLGLGIAAANTLHDIGRQNVATSPHAPPVGNQKAKPPVSEPVVTGYKLSWLSRKAGVVMLTRDWTGILGDATVTRTVLWDAQRNMPRVFAQMPAAKEVCFQRLQTYVDVRGHDVTLQTAAVCFKRRNAETINWDNVSPDSLPKIADYFYSRAPAYQAR